MFGKQLEKFLSDNHAHYTWVRNGQRRLARWESGQLIVWAA